MRLYQRLALFSTIVVLVGCRQPGPTPSQDNSAESFAILQGRQVFQPQLVGNQELGMVLIWREVETEGSNIYVARTDPFNRFSAPLRVNSGSVGTTDMDEIRPALAVGRDGRFAIAWGARDGNVWAALSRDGARSFAEPVRLNQDEKRAYRGFPAIAFDSDNVLHGIWIDAREAPPRAEEPADLYLAVVGEDGVREINLTARQEASICGCCRPSLEAFGPELVATFRNTGDGYRDIFQISIQSADSFGLPEPLAAPMWELEGCPMAGPEVPRRERPLWMEASLGHWRLLQDSEGTGYDVVLEEDDAWTPKRPPRRLNGYGAEAATDLLLPGNPYGRRLTFVEGSWQPTADRLPEWATSGLLIGNRLLLIGATQGKFQFEERRLSGMVISD